MNPSELDAFLAACGSSEPLRIGVGGRDGSPSATWSFRQPFVVIGRSPESDLVLDDWQVSRRHAYLQLIGGRYYCVDLGSRMGTHGGDPSERSGWLTPGRPIWIGPYSVLPEGPSGEIRPSRPPSGVTWDLPDPAGGRRDWRMERQLVLIGRSPACKIRIVEPDVSKFHCSLVLTPHGAWAVDLLGQTGIFVNDEPVRSARIGDGDELRIGRHVLRARYDAPVGPPGRRPDAIDVEFEGVDDRPDPAPAPSTGTAIAAYSATGPGPSGPPSPTLRLVLPPDHGQGLAMAGELHAPGTAVGTIDPTVNLLVQQFGLMQQQMLDQFHNTMMMMFEGFAALHREQSARLSREIDDVRELSREIEALRAELAKPTPAKPPAPMPATPPSPAPARPSASPVPPARADKPTEPVKKPAPAPPPEADIHAQLCLRLATIQAERQNRWQKILGMMTSRS